MRSAREDPVNERLWPALTNKEGSTEHPHVWDKPRASDSAGLNPRRSRLRQCEGTGTSTVLDGGDGHVAAIHRPSRLAGSTNPPYFIRCRTCEVPRSAHKRNPKAQGRAPARKCPKAWLLALGGNTGHAKRHPGHVPATSFASNMVPQPQHRPKPNHARHMTPS